MFALCLYHNSTAITNDVKIRDDEDTVTSAVSELQASRTGVRRRSLATIIFKSRNDVASFVV